MHVNSGPSSDFRNALLASHNRTLLFADDCTWHWRAVRQAFKDHIDAGLLVPFSVHRNGSLGSDRSGAENIVPANMYYKHSKSGWCAGIVAKPMKPRTLGANKGGRE